MPAKTRLLDRRIQKTQKLLHEALIALILEKDYDSIVIQEILDRANVGRSTFYTHYRDKDELLVSGLRDLHDMLQVAQSAELPPSAKSYERLIAFSLPMFEHAHEMRKVYRATLGSRAGSYIRSQIQKTLAALIRAEFVKESKKRRSPVAVPTELFIEYVASSYLSVLLWWLDQPKNTSSCQQVNETFRSLVLPTLVRLLG